MKRAKDLLHAGNIERLLALFDELAVGRRAALVDKYRDYFDWNAPRMQFANFLHRKLPTGSGAFESAIRRVVNMRMKGNGTFWRIENAQVMLMLRRHLKAGRCDDLVDWSNTAATPGWTGPQQKHPSPISEALA